MTNVQRKMALRTNAKVLQQQLKEMQPQWWKQLAALNLSPYNTTVEFTESMEEEIKAVIDKELLKGPPKQKTIDELTQELYNIVQNRERQNRSVGHILLGAEPTRKPLLQGSVHIGPNKECGKYHLQYWPADELEEGPKILNGTIDLRDMKINLTHKHAGRAILRSILNLKPRELSHAQANKLLKKIFTIPTTYKTTIKTTRFTWKSTPAAGKKTRIMGGRLEEQATMTPFLDTKLYLNATTDVLQDSKEMAGKRMDTLRRIVTKTPMFIKETFKPISKEATTSIIEKSTQKRAVEKSIVKDFEIVPSTDDPIRSQLAMVEEFNKLKETITKSRNISLTLMNEMEAMERKTTVSSVDEKLKRKFDDKRVSFGGWKLQQRLKEFKPARAYPTMPPFVRRWPTFRTHKKVDLTSAPSPATEELYSFSTKLTMRPKYAGPRHEPFFFNDFKRIRTIYPTKLTTVVSKSTFSGIYNPFTTNETNTFKPLFKFTSAPNQNLELESTTLIEPKKASHVRSTENYSLWARSDLSEKSLKLEETNNEKQTLYNFSPSTTVQATVQLSVTTSTPKMEKSDMAYTMSPVFFWPTKRKRTTIPTFLHTTTTRRSHLHVIKHHVKTGLKKFLRIFGFGKSSSEEE